MKVAAFRDWLETRYVPAGASSRASEVARIEAAYGDLDNHLLKDDFASIFAELEYGAADEAYGLPNPSRIIINGNVRNGLASLKTALRCYQKFASSQATLGEG